MVHRNKKLLIKLRYLPCRCGGAVDGTICAAHRNQGKVMGLKNSDALVASLCFNCHTELDNGPKLSKQERRDLWNEAYVRTMQYLIENEILTLK